MLIFFPQDFVTGAPSLSSTLTDSTDWELVLNVDGSVSFRNASAGGFLNDEGGAIGLGNSSSATSSFWLERAEATGVLLLRNKATGACVAHGGGKLKTTDGGDEEQAGFTLVPRDPELAKSLAGSLAQAGGVSLLQNALSRVCCVSFLFFSFENSFVFFFFFFFFC